MNKRSTLCILLILLIFAGCSSPPKYETPVKYYYPKNQMTYHDPTGAIHYQLGEGNYDDLLQVLNTYLKGPEDLSFYNPFPQNVRVISVAEEDQLVTIMLSNEFAALTGIDATIACICLVKTTLELTEVSSIAITCESSMIDGDQILYFTEDQILWLDESVGAPQSSNTTAPSG